METAFTPGGNASEQDTIMAYIYSDPTRENDTYALPDVEIFQLTATEIAEGSPDFEDERAEFMRRPAFRLASMNNRTREKMIDAMIEELGINGGWFYQFCFPGCLPEGDACGPYATRQDAIDACRDMCD